MIRGLIKRRFWWNISENYTPDCLFAWTQIKIKNIYQRQQTAPVNKNRYVTNKNTSINTLDNRVCMSDRGARIKDRRQDLKKAELQRFNQEYDCNQKVWNQTDKTSFSDMFRKDYVQMVANQGKQLKHATVFYSIRTKQAVKAVKDIKMFQNIWKLPVSFNNQQQHNYYRVKPIVHNHLPQNYHLGNKKALFYNLKQYYKLTGQDVFDILPLTFHIKKGTKDTQYARFVKYYTCRAQFIKKQQQKQGKGKTRNIWIVKPGEDSNQGRGITVIDQIYQLDRIIKQSSSQGKKKEKEDQEQTNRTFIVQLYMDRPLLYRGRKFDIRHYMLITNLYGITRAYWYDQGYIRTSAYPFTLHDFDPSVHLTNDAIQKHFPEYGRYQPYNKLSYSDFQNYLNSIPDNKINFRKDVMPHMKAIATDSVKSVCNIISPGNLMNNFQIFGLDFMLDRNMKPWLIQINTNPCLDCCCPLLNRIIPYMVQQALKLSLDIVYPPPSHYPNTAKHYAPYINMETFKYELIFDSLHDGQKTSQISSKTNKKIQQQIGQIGEDQQFADNGHQIKLQAYS